MSEPSDEERAEVDAELLGRDAAPDAADTDSDPDLATDDPVEESPVREKRRGRGLLVFTFFTAVLAAGALGLAGYLYYLLVMLQPLAPLDSRIAGIESGAGEIAGQLAGLKSAQEDALRKFAAGQKKELQGTREDLLEAVNQVTSQTPPSSREWRVAEVAYLLRIANHRVLMERDVEAALELLSAADSILMELDDFSFYEVRARLADELLALQGVQGNDVQGIYLRLEAVKGDLEQLPLRLPEYLAAREAATPPDSEPATFWEALRAQLTSYLRVRRFSGTIKPLLSNEEAAYLELNLRLMLERAQLATLRREQVVYESSLTTAADWLMEYIDTDAEAVMRVVNELKLLTGVKLDQELPDISGSLAALQAARRGT